MPGCVRSSRRRGAVVRAGRAALTALLLAATSAPDVPAAPLQDEGRERATELGRALTAQFYGRDLDALAARMSEQMRAALGGVEGLTAFRGQVEVQLGAETEVVSENVRFEGGFATYVRRARFEKTAAMDVEVIWSMDREGTVAGFLVRPAESGPPSEAAGDDAGDWAATVGTDGVRMGVPIAPIPVSADTRLQLAWELVISNDTGTDLTIQAVEVGDGERSIVRLENSSLIAAISDAGVGAGPVPLPAGQSRVVYLWHSGGQAPDVLLHTVSFAAAGAGADAPMVRAHALELTLGEAEPVVVGPPLRGGYWLAGNGPGNASNHRRARINAGGRPTIAQRFAIDFVQLEGSSTFDGDREDNAAYHAYGQDLLAVADGVVAGVRDGIPENVPGINSRAVEITMETVAGNYVIIDLGAGRYAMYAHLIPGSLRVAVGDPVRRGDVIGSLGNSGNSTEPHLHFQVSDSPEPLGGEGLPYVFDEFRLQGMLRDLENLPPPDSAPIVRGEIPLLSTIVSFER